MDDKLEDIKAVLKGTTIYKVFDYLAMAAYITTSFMITMIVPHASSPAIITFGILGLLMVIHGTLKGASVMGLD